MYAVMPQRIIYTQIILPQINSCKQLVQQ